LAVSRPCRFDSHPCSTKLKPPSLAVLPSCIHNARQTVKGGSTSKRKSVCCAPLFNPPPNPLPGREGGCFLHSFRVGSTGERLGSGAAVGPLCRLPSIVNNVG
jgi:hypothetical protein